MLHKLLFKLTHGSVYTEAGAERNVHVLGTSLQVRSLRKLVTPPDVSQRTRVSFRSKLTGCPWCCVANVMAGVEGLT